MSRPVKNARRASTPKSTKPNSGKATSYGGVKSADARKPIGPNYEVQTKNKWEGPTQVTNRFTSKGD